MPRLQVYLPDDLYRVMKRRHFSPSELLQRAIRGEVARLALESETDRYLAELRAEVGEPTGAERAEARAWADRIAGHLSRTRAKAQRARKTG